MPKSLALPRDKIAEFCRRNHVRRLSLFGSALREDFRPESDVDILVEFVPGHVPGFAFFALQDELSELIGHRVDLNTPNFLSEYFREHVMERTEVLYAE